MAGSESKIGLIITGIFAVVAALVGASAFDRVFYPVVEVAVNQTQPEEMVITVTNYGSQPADNLTLFISHPDSPFINIINDFSTSDITLINSMGDSLKVLEIDQPIKLVSQLDNNNNNSSQPNDNNSIVLNNPYLLELFMKKFYHGTGSKAVIKLEVAKPISWSDFEASAVYAQGSANSVGANSLTYKGFIDNITRLERILAIAMIVGFILAVGLRWYLKIKQQQNIKSTTKIKYATANYTKPSSETVGDTKPAIGEKEIVAVIGIAEAAIFGSLYVFGIVRLNAQFISIIMLVAFVSVLIPHWQLFKPRHTKLKEISELQFIVVIGVGILVVMGFLIASRFLSLTKPEHILAIIPAVVFVSYLLPWAHKRHKKRPVVA